MTNPSSLPAFIGHNSSYTWKSLSAARGVLKMGSCWHVGTGNNISIMEDAWIPDSFNYMVTSNIPDLQFTKVSELIDTDQRVWKRDVVHNTFSPDDARKILLIPLAKEA